MKGPYFKGQQPSECGHYYPDVLRLQDEKKSDTKYVRVMDCAYCGRYELEIDLLNLGPELVRNLLKKGDDIGTRESEIEKVREKRKKKFLSEKEKDLILGKNKVD
jgi:hypothetical protein